MSKPVFGAIAISIRSGKRTLSKPPVCHCASCDPETEKQIETETAKCNLGLEPAKVFLRVRSVLQSRPTRDERENILVNLGLAKRTARLTARQLNVDDLQDIARKLVPTESWRRPLG